MMIVIAAFILAFIITAGLVVAVWVSGREGEAK